jgi:signal transduction histidine kinase
MPAWRWTLRATLFGAAATLLVPVVPLRFAYESPSLHVAFETAAASIALLAAYLVLGQFRHSRELDALLLGCGLGMMGGVNLLLGALPAALGQELGTASTWMSAVGRLVATIVLVAAAWAPPVHLRGPNVHRIVFLAAANVLFVLWLLLAFIGERLPIALDPQLAPESSSAVQFVGHPLVHGIQLAGALLFAAAAVGFLRKPGRDELSRWIAPACVLAAFASIQYFLFPSLYSQWFYTGDVFRLCFYLLLVAGVAREIWRYQAYARQLAVSEERRRIARDLHDGLAQELSFIVGAAESLQNEPRTSVNVATLASAAERALDESRRAIAALTQSSEEPLDRALAQAAHEVANRVGTRLTLELDGDVQVSASTREQLVRIVREAVTNAARHGNAQMVTVALTNGNGLTLRIEDDGLGFEPVATNGNGFGLVSMSERAHSLGGELRIVSAPTDGTAVEVLLPQAALE